MGSSMSHINDRYEEEQYDLRQQWLNQEAKRIKEINPMSMDYENFNWLRKNEEKILRNRRLIDLLG